MQIEAQENKFLEKTIAKEPGAILWWLLWFTPMALFVFYKNWKMLGEQGKARLQIAGILFGAFLASLSDDNRGILVYFAFLIAWSIWSYVSMKRYLNDKVCNRYTEVKAIKVWHYVSYAFGYVLLVLFLVVVGHAFSEEGRAEWNAIGENVDKADQEHSREGLLEDISGVWAISSTNQAVEIHFAEGRKWIKLFDESSWVTINHVDLDSEYVVFSLEKNPGALHTIRVNRGKDDRFHLYIAFAGEGVQRMHWVRHNVP